MIYSTKKILENTFERMDDPIIYTENSIPVFKNNDKYCVEFYLLSKLSESNDYTMKDAIIKLCEENNLDTEDLTIVIEDDDECLAEFYSMIESKNDLKFTVVKEAKALTVRKSIMRSKEYLEFIEMKAKIKKTSNKEDKIKTAKKALSLLEKIKKEAQSIPSDDFADLAVSTLRSMFGTPLRAIVTLFTPMYLGGAINVTIDANKFNDIEYKNMTRNYFIDKLEKQKKQINKIIEKLKNET